MENEQLGALLDPPVKPGTVSRWRSGELPEELRFPQIAAAVRVRTNWLRSGQGPREPGEPAVRVAEPSRAPYGTGEPTLPRERLQRVISAIELALAELRGLATSGDAGAVAEELAKDAADREAVKRAEDQSPPQPEGRQAGGQG